MNDNENNTNETPDKLLDILCNKDDELKKLRHRLIKSQRSSKKWKLKCHNEILANEELALRLFNVRNEKILLINFIKSLYQMKGCIDKDKNNKILYDLFYSIDENDENFNENLMNYLLNDKRNGENIEENNDINDELDDEEDDVSIEEESDINNNINNDINNDINKNKNKEEKHKKINLKINPDLINNDEINNNKNEIDYLFDHFLIIGLPEYSNFNLLSKSTNSSKSSIVKFAKKIFRDRKKSIFSSDRETRKRSQSDPENLLKSSISSTSSSNDSVNDSWNNNDIKIYPDPILLKNYFDEIEKRKSNIVPNITSPYHDVHSLSIKKSYSQFSKINNKKTRYYPQILFQWPPNKTLPTENIGDFCFPHGITTEKIDLTGSLSNVFNIIYGNKNRLKDDSSFLFQFSGKDGTERVYGICLIHTRIIHGITKKNIKRNRSHTTIEKNQNKQFNFDNSYSNDSDYTQWVVPHAYIFITKLPFFDFFLGILSDFASLDKLQFMKALGDEDINDNNDENIDSPLSPSSNSTRSSILSQNILYELIKKTCKRLRNVPIPNINETLLFQVTSDLPELIYKRLSLNINFCHEWGIINPTKNDWLYGGIEDAYTLFKWCIVILFSWIPLPNILFLIGALLAEKKVVVVGSNISLITATVFSLSLLLKPLAWINPIIPILPLRLIDFLEAPFPFLIGMTAPIEICIQPDVILLDTDSTSIILHSFDIENEENCDYISSLMLPGMFSLINKLKKYYNNNNNLLIFRTKNNDDSNIKLNEPEYMVNDDNNKILLNISTIITNHISNILIATYKKDDIDINDIDISDMIQEDNNEENKINIDLILPNIFIYNESNKRKYGPQYHKYNLNIIYNEHIEREKNIIFFNNNNENNKSSNELILWEYYENFLLDLASSQCFSVFQTMHPHFYHFKKTFNNNITHSKKHKKMLTQTLKLKSMFPKPPDDSPVVTPRTYDLERKNFKFDKKNIKKSNSKYVSPYLKHTLTLRKEYKRTLSSNKKAREGRKKMLEIRKLSKSRELNQSDELDQNELDHIKKDLFNSKEDINEEDENEYNENKYKQENDDDDHEDDDDESENYENISKFDPIEESLVAAQSSFLSMMVDTQSLKLFDELSSDNTFTDSDLESSPLSREYQKK